jgi:3-oxoadipate enol-lactonase
MPFAASQGFRIYYRLEGTAGKPPLLLVHSLGADHGMWDAQMPALLPHFQVLRLDLRGHGASDCPPSEYSIELLANDVLAVADTVGFNSFAYCGLSLGGMIGQWLAANVPGKLQRLVLANTSPKMAEPAIFDTRRTTVMQQGMKAIEDAVMQRFFAAPTLAAKDPYAESVRNVLLATDPVGYAGCCSAVRDMDNRALLEKIKLPVLVIGGDEDQSTPWSGHGDVLTQRIAGTRSLLLHAAHLSNIDQPKLFTSALVEFLLPPIGVYPC